MSPRSDRTTAVACWRAGLVIAGAGLALSACGGGANSEALSNVVPSEQAAPTETVLVTATLETPATTTQSPVSISIGPPTTSVGARVQPTDRAAVADEGSAISAAEVAPEESTPENPPAAQQDSTTTTAPPAAPVEPEQPATSPPTTMASTTTAPPSSSSSTTTPDTTTAPPEQPAQIVEFRIAPGTGAQPWNSFDNPVRVRVGQILRIYNDDSSPHAVHAGGSPFKHGQRIDPGGFRDHPILSPQRPTEGSPGLYDHNNGRGASFWVVAEG